MPNLLLRYALCDRNLYAIAAAAIVTALYLYGVIDAWWWVIAGAAYAAVWLLPVGAETKAEAPPVDPSTQQCVDWLRDKALERLPASARDILADILERVQDIMPRLKEMEGVGIVQAENRTALKQTVKTFLPNAVHAYLRLPPLYARTAKVADGHTAEELLLVQLRTLQVHVQEIQEGILSSEVDSLVSQSRYLNEKFAKPVSMFESIR